MTRWRQRRERSGTGYREETERHISLEFDHKQRADQQASGDKLTERPIGRVNRVGLVVNQP